MLRFLGVVLSTLTCFTLLSPSVFALNTYYLPQAMAGAGGDLQFGTQISIRNTANEDGWVYINFYNALGEDWTVPVECLEDDSLAGSDHAVYFSLPAKRKYTIKMSPSATMAGTGWVRIDSVCPLQVSATYGLYRERAAGGNLFHPLWEAAVLPSPSAHQLSFPAHCMQSDFISGVRANTAFALANPTYFPATVTAKIYDSADNLVDGKVFVLPAHGHRAQFIDELFTGADLTSFRGTVRFTSDHPIAGLAMKEATGDGGVYSTLPIDPESSFQIGMQYEEDNKPPDAVERINRPPSEVYGTVNLSSDDYLVEMSVGQTIEVILLAGSLGSPLNPSVTLLKDGATVATSSEIFTGSRDRRLSYRATTNDFHKIRVEAVGQTAGLTSFYRMFVRVR